MTHIKLISFFGLRLHNVFIFLEHKNEWRAPSLMWRSSAMEWAHPSSPYEPWLCGVGCHVSARRDHGRSRETFFSRKLKKKLLNILIYFVVLLLHSRSTWSAAGWFAFIGFFLVCLLCSSHVSRSCWHWKMWNWRDHATAGRVKNSHNSPWKFNDSACVLSVTNWWSLVFW